MSTPLHLYSYRSKNQNIRLLYIQDEFIADQELALLASEPVLGFDQEWKPVFKKGQQENRVALVQLASNHTILLLQLSAMRATPTQLRILLENPSIVKTGVGIQSDAQKLYNDHMLSMRNCVDLSLLARSVDNAQWKGKYKNPLGLARLIQAYENCTLSKGKITRSNWEAVLTQPQQEYAANDAHAGLSLYSILYPMAAAMTTVPSPSCYTFNYIRGRFCNQDGSLWHPHNPDYDPGPPPPPRPPKVPNASNLVSLDVTATSTPGPSTSTSTPSSFSGSPNTSPKNRHRYRMKARRLGAPTGDATGHSWAPDSPADQIAQPLSLARKHAPSSSSSYQYPRGLPRMYRPRGRPF